MKLSFIGIALKQNSLFSAEMSRNKLKAIVDSKLEIPIKLTETLYTYMYVGYRVSDLTFLCFKGLRTRSKGVILTFVNIRFLANSE